MAGKSSITPMRFAVSLIAFLAVVAAVEWGPSRVPVLSVRGGPASARQLGQKLFPTAHSCRAMPWSVSGTDRPFAQGRNVPSCLLRTRKGGLWATVTVYPGLDRDMQKTAVAIPPTGVHTHNADTSGTVTFKGCLSGHEIDGVSAVSGVDTDEWWTHGTAHGLLVECGELQRTATNSCLMLAATLRVIDPRSGVLVNTTVGQPLWDNTHEVDPCSGLSLRQLDQRDGQLLKIAEWKQLWAIARTATAKASTLSRQDLLGAPAH